MLDLKDRAVAKGATVSRSTKNIIGTVQHYPSVGLVAIRQVKSSECGDDAAALNYIEDRTVDVRGPAVLRCAEKVAGTVLHNPANGIVAIGVVESRQSR